MRCRVQLRATCLPRGWTLHQRRSRTKYSAGYAAAGSYPLQRAGQGEAENLLERSRRLLEGMHADGREEAIGLHEAIQAALESGDDEALRRRPGRRENCFAGRVCSRCGADLTRLMLLETIWPLGMAHRFGRTCRRQCRLVVPCLDRPSHSAPYSHAQACTVAKVIKAVTDLMTTPTGVLNGSGPHRERREREFQQSPDRIPQGQRLPYWMGGEL